MQGSSKNYIILSVFMPFFNKRGTQENMLRVVLNEPCVAEVIAVDEHSTDGSFELLERLTKHESRIKFLRYERHPKSWAQNTSTRLNHASSFCVTSVTGEGIYPVNRHQQSLCGLVLIQDIDLESDIEDYAAS
jgi:hypothetical protein